MTSQQPRKADQANAVNTSAASRVSKLWAVIPCAGTGSRALRAGDSGPKQYQMLLGQPLVMHTLAAFDQAGLDGVLLVVSPDDDFFDSRDVSTFATLSIAACGGLTRAQSVLNGLKHMLNSGARPDDWVLVHDAARCLITPEQIRALVDACAVDTVGGLLALPLPDTLKVAKVDPAHDVTLETARVAQTLDRSDKWLAQTPQMFRLGALKHAIETAGPQVTDEASAIEAMGLQPLLVKGSAQNFKVTYPEDFALAEAVLMARASQTHNKAQEQVHDQAHGQTKDTP